MNSGQRIAALVTILVLAACQKQTVAPIAHGGAAFAGAATIQSPRTPVDATLDNLADSHAREEESAKKARMPWQGKTFAEFRATVFKEPFKGGKYIVNGDVAIADEKQLLEFFEQGIKGNGESEIGGRLIVMAGPDGTWNHERKHQLTYCVSNAFGNRKAKVITDLLAATQEWESVTDIHYFHDSDEDASCSDSSDHVLFDVRPIDVNGTYLARAFFPNEPRASRNVLIDESAFHLTPGGNLQLVGILRHELGHTLGWRHEHTRPESGACFEDTNWVPMTSYDAFSVMHYPQCNGKGDWKLALTSKDRNGAACVYGAANGFVVDPSQVQGRCYQPAVAIGTPAAAKTEVVTAQSLAQKQTRVYPAFNARPGTVVVVNLTPASGADAGDADLYVQLGEKPGLGAGEFACRPFLSTSLETCEISTRGAPRNQIYVMVRGYTATRYDLKVSYVPN